MLRPLRTALVLTGMALLGALGLWQAQRTVSPPPADGGPVPLRTELLQRPRPLPAADADLQAMLAQQRGAPDAPGVLDWQSVDPVADASQTAALALAAQLNAGQSVPQDLPLQVQRAQPLADVVAARGADFAAALQAAPAGRWVAVPQQGRWRVVRRLAQNDQRQQDGQAGAMR